MGAGLHRQTQRVSGGAGGGRWHAAAAGAGLPGTGDEPQAGYYL